MIRRNIWRWLTTPAAITIILTTTTAATPSFYNDANRALQEEQQQVQQQRQTPTERINLVQLIPFDVTIALTENSGINIFEVSDVITQWMNDSFQRQADQLDLEGKYSSFDSVILDERRSTPTNPSPSSTNTDNEITGNGVRLLRLTKVLDETKRDAEESQQLKLHESQRHRELPERFVASYEGVSLWKHKEGLMEISRELVEIMERETLKEDVTLLRLLQTSFAKGLGSSVIDVRAFINPAVNIPADANLYGVGNGPNGAPNNDDLELIIVIAIVVACLAFAFLVFALFWAWKFDKAKRDAGSYGGTASTSPANKDVNTPYKNTNMNGAGYASHERNNSNGDESPNQDTMPTYTYDMKDSLPSEIQPTNLGSHYPDSVVSEDISTSLSAYYRSGLGTSNSQTNQHNSGKNFNDAGSFSSMESYGYSLDGYAPSLATYNNNHSSIVSNSDTINNNNSHTNITSPSNYHMAGGAQSAQSGGTTDPETETADSTPTSS